MGNANHLRKSSTVHCIGQGVMQSMHAAYGLDINTTSLSDGLLG